MTRFAVLLAGIAVAMSALVPPALAQEPGAIPVDVSDLLGLAVQGGGVLLLALGAWAIRWTVYKLKLDADDRVRAYLQSALESAVAFGVDRAAAGAAAKLAKIEVRNQVVAEAVKYANAHVPDALKHFGIDGPKLAEMLRARLPNPPAPPGQAT